MPNKKQPTKKTFKQAVVATPEVSKCYKAGLQAIPTNDRKKVELTDTRKCGGSLFIDQCLVDQKLFAQDNRWDYAIDYNGEVYFLEVHSAKTDEVSTVIKKLDWLKQWITNNAPEINKLKAKSKTPYYWVQTEGYHIMPGSAQERAANQKGIKPIAKLVLK